MIRQQRVPTSRSAVLLGGLVVVTAMAIGVSAGRQLSAESPADDAQVAAAEPAASRAHLEPAEPFVDDADAHSEPGPTDAASRSNGSTAPAVVEPTADPLAWMSEVGRTDRIFLGVSTPTDSIDEVDAFAQAAGRDPEVVMVSRDFASGVFDLDTAQRLVDNGHVPLLAWEPWNHAHALSGRLRSVQPAYALSTIWSGKHDDVLRAWARGAADFGHPLFIRFAHEMNGFWYPWAESANGNAEGDFIRAWRHVHAVFEEEGATNVRWVWSPNLSQPSLTPLAQLWPGDDYVDYVGLVGYLGNGIDPSVWAPTFDELFGPTIDEVRDLTDLPIIITEIGATELGGRKAEWILDATDAVERRGDIVGLVWFEIDKESDWRIVSSVDAADAFASGVADGRWGIPRS